MYKENDIIEHNHKVAVVKRVLSDKEGVVLLIQYIGSRVTHHIGVTDETLCNISGNEERQVLRISQDIDRILSEYKRTLRGTGALKSVELLNHLCNSIKAVTEWN